MRIILSTYVLVCFCSLIMQNFALAGENNNTFFLAQKNKEKGLLEKAIEKEIKKSGKGLIEKAIENEIQKVGKRLIEKAIEKEIKKMSKGLIKEAVEKEVRRIMQQRK